MLAASARSMATLSAIKKRIQSTKNIKKITASMKMVAAAKMRGDQRRLDAGREFGRSMAGVLSVPSASEEDGDAVPEEQIEKRAGGEKVLLVAVCSDRGLCGGVNSAVARLVRDEAERLKQSGAAVELFVVGEKGRAQLMRRMPHLVHDVLDEAWRNPINFAVASSVAARVAAKDFDVVKIAYNKFKSAIAYDTLFIEMPRFAKFDDPEGEDLGDKESIVGLPHLATYDYEPEEKEGQLGLFEFSLASSMYGAFLDSLASEQSARMNAMDNASKNAGEMIEKLTLQYNRVRQAKITTELTEIISGAESLKG